MNKKKSILESNVLYTIIAIIAGLLIGAVFLMIAGISPAVAYGKLFSSIFSKPKYLVWTLVYASPLIFTGLSVAFSFRTGVFNIGAEGQFVIGGLVACVLGIVLKLPAGLHAIVCLVAAAAAGCIWSLIVGILKVKRGIHEVLSFIMFNWIAFYLSNYVVNLPGIHRDSSEATQDVAASARLLMPEGLRSTLDCSNAHWGIVLAVIAAVIIWVIIEKTTLGYKLKAVGFNSNGAEYGINPDRPWNFRTVIRSWWSRAGTWYGRTSQSVCRTGRLRVRRNYGCPYRIFQSYWMYFLRTFLWSYEIRRIQA